LYLPARPNPPLIDGDPPTWLELGMALHGPAVRRAVERLAAIPALRDRYAPVLAAGAAVTLTDLPELSRADVRAAVRAQFRAGAATGAYLYVNGGTLPEPDLILVPPEPPAVEAVLDWPIGPGDVVTNLFAHGPGWSMHHFHNVVAARSGAVVLPFGAPRDDELDRWLDFFDSHGVSALAAPPGTIRQIVRYCAAAGRRPAALRTLLWSGEPYDDVTAELVAHHLPEVGRWGTFAVAEVGAVGHNGPRCDPDTFHPLPGQHVEVIAGGPAGGDGRLLVSTLHEQHPLPLLRYDIGYRGRSVSCACAAGTGVRVLGRTGSSFTLNGRTICPEDVVQLARAVEEVDDARLVLVNPGTAVERLELHMVAQSQATLDPYLYDWVRHRVLIRHVGLEQAVASRPEAFEVVADRGSAGSALLRVEWST
jgi:hypothetical protein